MRDRVARARSRLPKEMEEPIIAEDEADAKPIINISFKSDHYAEMKLNDFAERT